MGPLWEHFVLNEIHAALQTRSVLYWRDKRGREIDFVIATRGSRPVAIECKWTSSGFEPRGVKAFRRYYPEGKTYVVSNDVDRPYRKIFGDIEVKFVSLGELIRELKGTGPK
jgi:predicted AAA+ superfamily ATPase